ncbi:hypothetical protein MKEN_00039600 [Mycena kentingensis (nom. inval.)]|nr:hypothetical protein MKEN_00039600 [Mycena kentingensis (nom. inval.)]
MMSWLTRHRPRRSKEQSDPLVLKSAPPEPFRRQPRRQDTDATLVNSSECPSPRSSFFSRRSSTLFNSPPPSPLHAPKPLAADDPGFWKTLQQHGVEAHDVHGRESPASPPKTRRSRFSKLMSKANDTVVPILGIGLVIGEASNIPYLKGLAGIILLVSNSVQATEDNKVDCARLLQMVRDIDAAATRQTKEFPDEESLSRGLETVKTACNRILDALQQTGQRSYAKRFLDGANERNLLAQCEKELQHCLEVFQLRFHITANVSVARRDTAEEIFESQVKNVLEPVKNLLGKTIVDEPESYFDEASLRIILNLSKKNTTPLSTCHPNPKSSPVAKPSSTPLLLCWDSLAQGSRHLPSNFFTTQKWRIGLQEDDHGFPAPQTKGKERLLAPKKCYDDWRLFWATLQRSASDRLWLVVFDDLDDAWDTDSAKDKLEVEDLLTDISAIPDVFLLITLCGTQRPLGPSYMKSGIPALGAVPPAAARQIFAEISGQELDDIDAEDLSELLSLVGHHPFAVTLLAQRAQFEPLDFLLANLREEGPAMLADDGLRLAIAKSLSSARMRECPAALSVLRVLARSPEGVRKTEVSALIAHSRELESPIPVAMVNKCVSVLHKTALAIIVPPDAAAGAAERVKIPEIVSAYLAPI